MTCSNALTCCWKSMRHIEVISLGIYITMIYFLSFIFSDILHLLDQSEDNETESKTNITSPPMRFPDELQQYEKRHQKADNITGIDIDSCHLDEILAKAKSIRASDLRSNCGGGGGNSSSSKGKIQKKGKSEACDPSVAEKLDRRGRPSASQSSSSSSLSLSTKRAPGKATSRTASAVTSRQDKASPDDLRTEADHISLHSSHQQTPLGPVFDNVDTILAMKLTHPLESVLPSKSLLLSQMKLLSQFQARPCFPPSALHSVFLRHFSHHFPGDWGRPPSLDQCARYLSKARSVFERNLQLKIKRQAVSESDAMEMCVLWWNVRWCVHVYEKSVEPPLHTVDANPFRHDLTERGGEWEYNEQYGAVVTARSGGRGGDEAASSAWPEEGRRLQGLCYDLVGSLPLLTPSAVLSAPSSLAQYHEQMMTRASYAVETVLSKLVLRPVLREMKECVAATCNALANESGCAKQDSKEEPRRKAVLSSPASVDSQWVSALQLYQATYQMLSAGGDGSSPHRQRGKKVIFFKKDTTL